MEHFIDDVVWYSFERIHKVNGNTARPRHRLTHVVMTELERQAVTHHDSLLGEVRLTLATEPMRGTHSRSRSRTRWPFTTLTPRTRASRAFLPTEW